MTVGTTGRRVFAVLESTAEMLEQTVRAGGAIVTAGDGTTRAERRAWRRAAEARLRWAIRRSGLTRAAAERLAGLAPGTVGHLFAGRRGITIPALEKLARVLRVRAGWLTHGEAPAWWVIARGRLRWGVDDDGSEGWHERGPGTSRFVDRAEVRAEMRRQRLGARLVGVVAPRFGV